MADKPVRVGQAAPIMLTALAGGALEERWQVELERVQENIADPNTDAKQKRVITMTVEITPNSDRNLGDVTVSVTSKLSASKKVATLFYFGRTAAGLVAQEHNPHQMTFEETPAAAPPAPSQSQNIAPFGARKAD